ncbi:MAG: T9SS type A sorting domain-containing protein [Bacteroidales bacterium]|nr:T9SS type A sorting domain-containing protein [Bacteroidales bacterium]
MKKLVLFVLALVVSMAAFSQSIKLYHNGQLCGDTLYLNVSRMYDDNSLVIGVMNNTNDSLFITVEKEVISELEGSYNTFCLGVCYDASTTVSPNTLDLAAGQTSTNDDLHFTYNPMGNFGVTTVKYKFYDQRINEAPAQVVVNYVTEEVSIENHVVNVNKFNAYPNPATSQVTVQYELANRLAGDNAHIIITSLVGNKVCSQPVSNNNGKATIDLSNLVAGIYFYSLEVNGQIVSTKKLIVK